MCDGLYLVRQKVWLLKKAKQQPRPIFQEGYWKIRGVVIKIQKHTVMPVIGLLVAGVDLAALKIVLKSEVIERYLDKEVITSEVAINIGLFLNAVI